MLNINLISFLVVAIPLVWILVYWHRDSETKINLTHLVIDDKGKTSIWKIGQVLALVVTTWYFVLEAQLHTLRWEVFATYIAVWTGVSLTKALAKPDIPSTAEDDKK